MAWQMVPLKRMCLPESHRRSLVARKLCECYDWKFCVTIERCCEIYCVSVLPFKDFC